MSDTTDTSSQPPADSDTAAAPAAQPSSPGASAASSAASTKAATDSAKPGTGSLLTGDPAADSAKASTASVPETYAFTLPEGQTLDSAAVEAVTPVFRELGLSQDNAQKLVSAFATHAAKAEQQREEGFREFLAAERTKHEGSLRKEWGQEYDANLRLAQRAIGRFASPALKKILEDTGLANHAEMVKAFVPIGRMIQEDSPPSSGNQGGRRLSNDEVFYGKQA